MIRYKDLLDNGFIEDGEWNGRDYFTKNGFNIVCHNGNVYRYNRNNPSGYGKNFKTIEDLNDAYKKWAENFIEKFEQVLIAIKESLKK
jgi:hypothetical protein